MVEESQPQKEAEIFQEVKSRSILISKEVEKEKTEVSEVIEIEMPKEEVQPVVVP